MKNNPICEERCSGDCAEDCKEENGNIERYTFEATLMMAERTIRRLWILSLVLIFLLLATNSLWIYYESQFETIVETTTTQEVTQDTGEGGNNNFIGGDNYGNPEGENDNDNKKEP